ncbi:MAG TPA: ATP-binding protein [Armatimonadota bacterium]|jgi:two-component system phosphate regulon sensor histidine kinase PhoR
MQRKRLLWQLFPSYLVVVLFTLVAITWYDAHSLHAFYRQQTAADLQRQAQLVAAQVQERLTPENAAQVDALCKQLGKLNDTRITVILPNGQVIGDSDDNPRAMENHADRREIQEAYSGKIGQQSRYSHTLHQEMMYVAIPARINGKLAGVVRTSLPIISLGRPLMRIDMQFWWGGLVIAALAAGMSWLASRRIARPLEELRVGAQQFADGHLKQRLHVPDSEEIGSLAIAMNDMAAQLDERISTILQHRNEQEAILSSMIEGVIAVDMGERVISANAAAARMLQVEQDAAIGRMIQEVVRNADLQKFVGRTLSGTQPVEADIVLRDGQERFLQANGALLHDARGKQIGAVIVLNDVTRIRRLENMRREFVANVSHELRTPITAIKGFVETLLDGGLDEREEAEHFLTIVSKQVDRLNVIIEDLLLLSTIEQGHDRSEIGLTHGLISEVIQTALQVCALPAAVKGIDLRVSCPPELSARINPPLLEQALINLIDNAIKYSEPDGHVTIDARCEEHQVVISVADTGCGIAQEHLVRLFERFYRVDKARSRKLGGTGLGLAIVKHIAQAHGGHVAVASTPGHGSTFSICLPTS